MLHRLKIVNFQAVRIANIELGKFTVLSGISNSGKSATLRALNALVCNLTGSGWISHGANRLSITAELDSGTVTLEREGSSSKYKVHQNGVTKEFTKLAGEVPSEVSSIIGIKPGEAQLAIAEQQEKPYLLEYSGKAEVAKVIGSLTNVDTIYRAVQESNRLKTSSNSQFKAKEKDLNLVTSKIEPIKDVYDISAELDELSSSYEKYDLLCKIISSLETSISQIEVCQTALVDVPQISELPSTVQLAKIVKVINAIELVIQEETEIHNELNEYQQHLTKLSSDLEEIGLEYESKKQELGICPVCGKAFCNE